MTLTAMRAIGWFLLVVAFFAMEPAQKLKDKEETTTSTHAISLSDADVVETALVLVSIVGAVMVQPWVIVTLAVMQLCSVILRLHTGVPVLAIVELLALMLLANYREEIQNWMRAPPPE